MWNGLWCWTYNNGLAVNGRKQGETTVPCESGFICSTSAQKQRGLQASYNQLIQSRSLLQAIGKTARLSHPDSSNQLPNLSCLWEEKVCWSQGSAMYSEGFWSEHIPCESCEDIISQLQLEVNLKPCDLNTCSCVVKTWVVLKGSGEEK